MNNNFQPACTYAWHQNQLVISVIWPVHNQDLFLEFMIPTGPTGNIDFAGEIWRRTGIDPAATTPVAKLIRNIIKLYGRRLAADHTNAHYHLSQQYLVPMLQLWENLNNLAALLAFVEGKRHLTCLLCHDCAFNLERNAYRFVGDTNHNHPHDHMRVLHPVVRGMLAHGAFTVLI